MKRKVNQVGTGTLTVSLPNKWAEKHGIKKGDEIEVEEEESNLVISVNNTKKLDKVEVYVKKPKRLVSRTINNLYRKGVSEIKIRFDEQIIIKDIQKMLPLLMGFEITEQGKDFLIIKNIMQINHEEYDQTFRRLFLITLNLSDESYEAIKKGEFEELEGISELESIQNKYYMFCCRVINTSNGMFKMPTLNYLLVQRLEDIADDYKYICRYILENEKIKITKETLEYYNEINKVLRNLYDLYYDFNIEQGKAIIEHKKNLIEKGLELIEKVPKKEIRIIHCLNNALVKIYEASSPIYGMNL